MFVCMCRAVKESRIRSVIAEGASTVDEVEAACGAGGDCGSCREEISELISEASLTRCARAHAERDTHAPRAA